MFIHLQIRLFSVCVADFVRFAAFDRYLGCRFYLPIKLTMADDISGCLADVVDQYSMVDSKVCFKNLKVDDAAIQQLTDVFADAE